MKTRTNDKEIELVLSKKEATRILSALMTIKSSSETLKDLIDELDDYLTDEEQK